MVSAPLMLLALSLFSDGPFDPDKPSLSELKILTTATEIIDISAAVTAHEDAECFGSGYLVLSCFVDNRTQVYQITEDQHPAHPAIYFRGFELDEAGKSQLAERGWFAGDEAAAGVFFARGQDSMVQPIKPK